MFLTSLNWPLTNVWIHAFHRVTSLEGESFPSVNSRWKLKEVGWLTDCLFGGFLFCFDTATLLVHYNLICKSLKLIFFSLYELHFQKKPQLFFSYTEFRKKVFKWNVYGMHYCQKSKKFRPFISKRGVIIWMHKGHMRDIISRKMVFRLLHQKPYLIWWRAHKK